MLLLPILASAASLLKGVATTSDPLFAIDAPPSLQPVAGLYAIAPADCAPPISADLTTWPQCAQPVGFNGQEVAALKKPDAGQAPAGGKLYSIARTRYSIAAGAAAGSPGVAEVELPIFLTVSYIYVAVKPDDADAAGAFTSARAWPIRCRPPLDPNVVASPPADYTGPSTTACSAKSLADIQALAAASVIGPGYVLKRVMDAPAPAPAPATTP